MRRSRNHNYLASCGYLLTVVTEQRKPLLGERIGRFVAPSEAGRMVLSQWGALAERFPWLERLGFVLAPDHVHAAVWLRPPSEVRSNPVSDVLRVFKSSTTTAYIEGVRKLGWKRFPGRLWQRRSDDRILASRVSVCRALRYLDGHPKLLP